jgi:transaldolase
MKFFLDTSNRSEIQTWLDYGVIDGVTTNPSIMRKDGHSDLRAGAREIARMIAPRPVSVEVYAPDMEGMYVQARQIADWADNIAVKVPILTDRGEPCLRIIRRLAGDGVKVNCTACMSFGQAMMAAKAGATYVSLFAGRIGDEGGDPETVIRSTRQWLDAWRAEYKSEIIVGSIREARSVQQAAIAGAHIITVPPAILAKVVDHKYSRYTAGEFARDGAAAFDSKPANSR